MTLDVAQDGLDPLARVDAAATSGRSVEMSGKRSAGCAGRSRSPRCRAQRRDSARGREAVISASLARRRPSVSDSPKYT